MRIRSMLLMAALGTLGITTGCGDVGAVLVELDFPDEGIESRTQALLFRARQVPANRDGCLDLWGGLPADLRQKDAVIDYPNSIDVRALGIDLGLYTSLNFFVYAYTSRELEPANLLAGGCVEAEVSGSESRNIVIPLIENPN